MPPRKKLKLKKESLVQEKSQTSERKPLVAENDNIIDNFYLNLLPNEIMLNIYKYLSPADLLNIAELGDSRLKQLIFLTKEYDFSFCRRDNLNVTFFIQRQSMANNIRKLNFNSEMYLKPCEIVKFVCKCKNLTHLSIVNCGIEYHHVSEILHCCKKLQKLVCDVCEPYLVTISKDDLHSQLKTIYFLGTRRMTKPSSYSVQKRILFPFNIFINFSIDTFLAFPFHSNWCRVYCASYVNNVTHAYSYNSFQCSLEYFDFKKAEFLIEEKDPHWHPYVYDCPPFLQIQTLSSDISLLKSHASNTISSVSLILNPNIIGIWEDLVQALTEVGEKSLKHLSIDSTGTSENGDNDISGPILPTEALAVCDMLRKMFSTFKNITVLNIATVHFISCSPFITKECFNSVKVLSISSCAFKSFKFSGFEKVVQECPNVISFSLFCCKDDQNKLSEKDMIPMKEWKKLKHLTLYSLIFRNLSFLKKVAMSCKQLSSLSIISVYPSAVCLFMPDIIFVLKNAKCLSFIRINVENFNPMYEGFWSAIAEAKKLEGICLFTQSSTYITAQSILKAIKKLKYLHLFHFYAEKTSDNLFARVRKSIEQNGIKNVKLEREYTTPRLYRPYYHEQPRFSCTHLHLDDTC